MILKVMSFYGLATFCRRCIKEFSTIMSPTTDCRKKGEFKWTKYVPKAFKEIEEKLIVALVLRLLDFLKAFKVACDAPRIGIGGV